MTEMTESGALETWSTASCPFTIEYSRRALDDIRLAVVDAFFSLPRGGAEIGGVLLGKFTHGRVSIFEYAPLECDHIFGPSFTLSPGDHARLAEILSSVSDRSDLQPVGWYHSHTRSDIFLSEADLDIHNRYFPEPWQVALVLRPSTFQPVQAGFFFREPDGSMHSRASYQEFALDPLPVGQVPRSMPAPIAQPAYRTSEPEGPVITLVPEPVNARVPEPELVIAAHVPEPEPMIAPVPEPEPVIARAPEPPPLPEPDEAPVVSKPWEPAAAETVVPAAEVIPPPRIIPLPPALPPLATLELVPELDEIYHAPVSEVVAVEAPVAEETVVAENEEALVEPDLPPSVTPVSDILPATPELAGGPGHPIEPAPAAETKPAPQPEPKPGRPAAEPPSFLQVEPVRSRRRLWVVGTAAAVLVLGVGGYQQRASWLPQLSEMLPQRAAPTPAAPPVPLTLPLSASDQQGQLQIRWDSAARAITEARDGILQITDDGATTDLPLDAAHLQGGAYTYVRHGEHVDARLTVQELDGTQVHTVTSFFGPLPEPVTPVPADPALRKQNSELAKKNADVAKQNAELARQNSDLTKQNSDLTRKSAELTRENGEFQGRLDQLGKQTSKLKTDLAARAELGKQNEDLTRQNAELRQQRDTLAKQSAKLKADLAARTSSGKQNADLTRQNADVQQQRDDLLIQIAKLKADLAARAAASKQSPNAEFSKERYALTNQVSQLESDLAVATARADRLARQLEDLRKQQTQRRLQNQSGEQ